MADVALAPVYTCGPEDDLQKVLDITKQRRVRRLPVEGLGGSVFGIVSMNDLVLACGARKALREGDVLSTLQAICSHHRPTPHIAAA